MCLLLLRRLLRKVVTTLLALHSRLRVAIRVRITLSIVERATAA
jgi:hypothetical protein